ncbi:hypothetical protein C5167_018810, partial [Papaver somniferum]
VKDDETEEENPISHEKQRQPVQVSEALSYSIFQQRPLSRCKLARVDFVKGFMVDRDPSLFCTQETIKD